MKVINYIEIEKFMKDLSFLIEEYKFSMETISILCKIDLENLNDFYIGKDFLLYEEISLIESVLFPFISAIDIAKHNYNIIIKTRQSNKPFILKE
ncbi:HTH domain-containing protein [Clostridioides difficile]